MDKRAELVLELIVEHYTKTAEPVGSRALTKLIKFKISAATMPASSNTLRNMPVRSFAAVCLEEMASA